MHPRCAVTAMPRASGCPAGGVGLMNLACQRRTGLAHMGSSPTSRPLRVVRVRLSDHGGGYGRGPFGSNACRRRYSQLLFSFCFPFVSRLVSLFPSSFFPFVSRLVSLFIPSFVSSMYRVSVHIPLHPTRRKRIVLGHSGEERGWPPRLQYSRVSSTYVYAPLSPTSNMFLPVLASISQYVVMLQTMSHVGGSIFIRFNGLCLKEIISARHFARITCELKSEEASRGRRPAHMKYRKRYAE
ncbi:hypothetical protein PENSPDRAFT_281164 [Peniophora sp. CONT]|nr:hypothetical protein PENSPDRAFT_281164 [Peniophora sp. CONT]